MKLNMKKAAATALAVTMCLPFSAFAAQTSSSGEFTTSFDVYSPALTISVPVNLDVKVNPMADATGTGVDKYTVASNSIDIMNATVDADKGIPVNVTVRASITSAADDVAIQYNNVTPDKTSAKKNINLKLAEGTGTAITAKAGETLAFAEGKLKLEQFEVTTAANYASPSNAAAITKYGSLLSVDIAAPTTSDAGGSFSTDPTKVSPKVGSFAVIGEANYSADWKKDDVQVAVTYNVKASNPLTITTPALASGVTVTAGGDGVITIPGVGEAEVVAFAVHNDDAVYKDYVWTEMQDAKYTIEYVDNGGATDAKITIDKADPGLVFLADAANGCKGEAQDLIIALSDGRFVVSTLTAN